MIFTVTLNPAIDRTILIDEINQEDVTRVKKTIRQAAGKGINISFALKQVGTDSNAICILAGDNGFFIEKSLYEKDVVCHSINVDGNTRENIKVVQEKSKQVIELNEQGPTCNHEDIYELQELLEDVVNEGDIIVFSGSIPKGLPPYTYKDLIEFFKAKGLVTVLDASGDNLKYAIEASPSIVKPNFYELGVLFNKEISTKEEAIEFANKLLDQGVKEVLLTLGHDGSLYVSKEQVLHIDPLQVEVKNTVGAGDSFLAGYVHALEEKLPTEERLKYATAVATSSVMHEGTGPASLDQIKDLLNQITINVL